ncbi:palmitoyltransferase for Vac8p [Mortierella claussenii]|nr:palmitoyltransferase for Vac8p [Mortierella claussenii]
MRGVAWTPIAICLGLVSWSYYVFAFSVCSYLLSHDHVGQGIVYLITVTAMLVLLLWSYSLASFTSPGYPNEVIHKHSGYHSASHGDISMVDQDDAMHVGLLEPEQFYLSPSPNNSPLLADRRRVVAAAATTRDGGVSGAGRLASSPSGYVERSSGEMDITDQSQHQQHLSTPIVSASTRGLAQQNHIPSLSPVPPLPALQPVPRQQHPDHTIVRMSDDGSERRHGQNVREAYEGDNEDAEDNVPLGRSIRRFTVKRDGKMRYCQKCHFEKPDRTHHCSSCKRCVLKMDHHCPWLNNCVGHKNYKAFFLFVFWTAVYCVTLVACTIPVAAEVVNLPYSENLFDPQWIFVILAGLIFGLCLVPFAINHVLLIKSNKTTIESFEKHKYRVGNSGEVMQSRILNVFDLGRRKNFDQVLGSTWYLWLVPVRNSIGDGWNFPANDYGKSMLCLDEDTVSTHSSFNNQWTGTSSLHSYQHDHLNLGYTQYQEGMNHSLGHYHESLDLNDTSDLDQDHYRRDSDESDNGHEESNEQGGRRYPQPTPRRFRQQQGGFAATLHESDDEGVEEYLYDSDEPVTIRFTDTGR